LNIPESGNGTPDILNETRWNLEWMLNMQDDDGGVWHKQTSEHFPAFVMPEDDHLPSEVIGTGQAPYKSTCATADLAAVAAIAARVYQPFDAKFAARNLAAARKAWLWTESILTWSSRTRRESALANTATTIAVMKGCGPPRNSGGRRAKPPTTIIS